MVLIASAMNLRAAPFSRAQQGARRAPWEVDSNVSGRPCSPRRMPNLSLVGLVARQGAESFDTIRRISRRRRDSTKGAVGGTAKRVGVCWGGHSRRSRASSPSCRKSPADESHAAQTCRGPVPFKNRCKIYSNVRTTLQPACRSSLPARAQPVPRAGLVLSHPNTLGGCRLARAS